MKRAAAPMFSPRCASTRRMTGPAVSIQFLVLSVPAPGMAALFPHAADRAPPPSGGDGGGDLAPPWLAPPLIVNRRESGGRHRPTPRRKMVDGARARGSLTGMSHEARWRSGFDHQSETIAGRLPRPARN